MKTEETEKDNGKYFGALENYTGTVRQGIMV